MPDQRPGDDDLREPQPSLPAGTTPSTRTTSGSRCPTPRSAMLLATINASIVLISLPAIFRGIGLDPLAPGNVSYLLWMLMGFLLVTAVFVVTFGRLGDIYGRVRIYNLGFVVFASRRSRWRSTRCTAARGALWLIVWRVVQGVGGAMLFANSTAILTDAFPVRPARAGARHQPGGRDRRLVHRPGPRRRCSPSGTGARSSG